MLSSEYLTIFLMAIEIERQFIVNTEHPEWIQIRETLPSQQIVQSTIHRGDGNKLRVRLITDNRTGKKSACFTFKVKKTTKKTAANIRDEYEWDVPYRVALFVMIGHGEVHKKRYLYKHTDGKVWEFDEYQGPNEGIVLADIELKEDSETFELPPWLGKEVTKEKKITNASFTLHPYIYWSESEKSWYNGLKKRK